MSIDHEIFQSHWKSPLQKAVVNAMFTSRFLEERAARQLKPFRLTPQQFNVLRILRGQKGAPATVRLLTERMLDKSSNASRLVDKLVEKALVERRECPVDRRAVDILITAEGLAVLSRADQAMDLVETIDLPGFGAEDCRTLSDLLDRLRDTLRQLEEPSGSSKPPKG